MSPWPIPEYLIESNKV